MRNRFGGGGMRDHPRLPDHPDLPTRSLPQVETPSHAKQSGKTPQKQRSHRGCVHTVQEGQLDARVGCLPTLGFDLWTRCDCLFRLLILVLRLFDRVAASPPAGRLGKPPVLFCQGLKGVQLLSESCCAKLMPLLL